MKSKFISSLISTLMLVAFQNCGQNSSAVTYYSMSQNRGNAMDPGKVLVGPAVWPRSDSTASNTTPLSISHAALPVAIDFEHNPNYDESTSGLSWGSWVASWKQLPLESHIYLGQSKYFYRLDLFKNAVVDLSSDEVVYELNAPEVNALKAIIQSAILANASQFAATAACVPTGAEEYASLETDYGMFDLGAGNPCAVVDLFRNDNSGQSAGLQNFLTGLQSKF